MTELVQGTRTFVRDDAPKPRVEVVARAAEDRDLSKAPRTGATTVYRYLLVLRFAVLNLTAFALLGAAYLQGWVAAWRGTAPNGGASRGRCGGVGVALPNLRNTLNYVCGCPLRQ